MSGFNQALPGTLRFEGGYVNDPDDPGGATNKGITQATYDLWRTRDGLPTKAVRLISGPEVTAIYHREYWVKGKCDAMPWPMSMCHFDACVNHGPKNAAKLLQRALAVADDGQIGPITLHAVEHAEIAPTLNLMLWKRLEFYEAIARRRRASRKFVFGWLARVNSLRRRVAA